MVVNEEHVVLRTGVVREYTRQPALVLPVEDRAKRAGQFECCVQGLVVLPPLVVAELIKPTMPSLGYLLALAGAYPRVPTIMIALAAIALLVLISDGLTLVAYRWATRWVRRRHE